jgi:tetratricopeptide (TPR) repeat protein
MQVGTDYNLLPLFGTSSGTTGAAGAASTTTSLFGPAAILSLGQDTSGGADYSNLVAPLPALPNNLPIIWQFDLASVLNPTVSGVSSTPRSDEQQKADDEAVKQALDYINAGETDKARELMNNLLAQNKTNAAAVQTLGQAELTDGRYQKAEQLFLKAHVLDPTAGYDKDAQNARTLQEDDATVLERARAMVATALRRNDGVRLLIALTKRTPGSAEAHMLLAEGLAQEKDEVNALLEYHTAIRTADPMQLAQIGSQLRAMADRHPDVAYIRQLIGKVELRQERYGDAVQTLTLANKLSGDQPQYEDDLSKAYVGLGRQRLADGDINAAMANFQQAQDLRPTELQVKEASAQGYVARAELRVQQLAYSDALADYQKAADLLGKSANKDLRERAAHGAYALGLQLQRQRVAAGGNVDGEVVAFQAAYDLDNKSTTYRHRLAETRAAMGDQYLADQNYKAAAYAYQRAHVLYKYDATYKQKTIDAFVAWGDQQALGLVYDTMIQAYGEAYKLDTTNVANKQKLAEAYNARGLDYRFFQKWKLAVADFKEALHLFPDNAGYQANYNALSSWDT